MVQKIFKFQKSQVSPNGWEIVEQASGKVLNLPSICYEDLKGKYLSSDDMIEKIETAQIVLAGTTDSLNIVDPYSYDRRSVLKTFGLKSSGTIDDSIDGYLESVQEYELYHTIEMDRDKAGDDNSIHAYLETPKDGRLRCTFDNSIRLNAKRNNIKYWVADYKIDAGSAGGKFVRPIGTPEEIM
jgi:hypothetical protein